MFAKILASITILINVIIITFLVDNFIATLAFWILSGMSVFFVL
ncbi:hypothetical protein [Anaerobacillus alkalidiazotrophicus]|nr:hypothetical protein [Anaerobacillus alkalidiazotrophicus]